MDVCHIVIHGYYNGASVFDDIALLEVCQPIQFREFFDLAANNFMFISFLELADILKLKIVPCIPGAGCNKCLLQQRDTDHNIKATVLNNPWSLLRFIISQIRDFYSLLRGWNDFQLNGLGICQKSLYFPSGWYDHKIYNKSNLLLAVLSEASQTKF